MAVSIRSNIAALQAQRQLAESSANLSLVFERLSSGSRINRASDDAAGLAVSTGLNVRQRVFGQGVRNLNDGISVLNVVDEALGRLSGIVTRQRELAEQSANGVFSGTQRVSLDREAQELAAEYRRVLEGTTFNGLSLLSPSAALITLQAGIGANATLSIETLQRIVSTTFDSSTTFDNTVISGTTFGQGDGSPAIGTLVDDMHMFVLDYNNDGYDDLLAVGLQNGGANLNYGVTLFAGGVSGLTEVSDISDTVSYNGLSINERLVFFDSDTNQLIIGVNDNFDYAVDIISIPSNGSLPGSTVDTLGFFGPYFGSVPETNVFGDFNNDGVNDTATFSTGVLTANGKSITIALSEVTQTSIQGSSYQTLDQSAFDLLSSANALSALDDLALLLQRIAESRGRIGVSLSRVETATQVLRDTREQLAAAESRITDTDIARDSSHLTRLRILQQTGAAVLAQANIQPALALTLLAAN